MPQMLVVELVRIAELAYRIRQLGETEPRYDGIPYAATITFMATLFMVLPLASVELTL